MDNVVPTLPRVYVRTHFDVYMPGTFLKNFRTYTHMRGDAPPTYRTESSEWVFAAVHCSTLPELYICPKICVFVQASTNTDICTGQIHVEVGNKNNVFPK